MVGECVNGGAPCKILTPRELAKLKSKVFAPDLPSLHDIFTKLIKKQWPTTLQEDKMSSDLCTSNPLQMLMHVIGANLFRRQIQEILSNQVYHGTCYPARRISRTLPASGSSKSSHASLSNSFGRLIVSVQASIAVTAILSLVNLLHSVVLLIQLRRACVSLQNTCFCFSLRRIFSSRNFSVTAAVAFPMRHALP